jgi:hypothetical protein
MARAISIGSICRGVATVNRRLASIRPLPFLPANVIVILILAVLAFVSCAEALASAHDSSEPEPVSLDRVFAKGHLGNRHVEVTGLIFPEAHLAYPPGRRGIERPARYVYIAMLGPEDRVLLVRFPGDLGHGAPRLVTVAGLLRPPEQSLSLALDALGWSLGGGRIERRYVLVAGMTPKPWWLMSLFAAATAIPALGLLAATVTARRNRPAIVPSIDVRRGSVT